jgi:hypothetical protein
MLALHEVISDGLFTRWRRDLLQRSPRFSLAYGGKILLNNAWLRLVRGPGALPRVRRCDSRDCPQRGLARPHQEHHSL